MTPRRRLLLGLLKLADLVVVTASIIFAVATSAGTWGAESWVPILEMRISLRNLFFVVAYLGVWHLVLQFRGLYRSYRLSPPWRELGDLTTAVVIATLPLIPLAAVLRFEYVTPVFLVVFPVTTVVGLALERGLVRALARFVRSRGHNLQDVVIVGDGGPALDAAAELMRRDELGYRIVEIVEIKNPRGSARNGRRRDPVHAGNGAHPVADDAARSADAGEIVSWARGADDGAIAPAAVLPRVAALLERRRVDEVFLAVPLDRCPSLVPGLIALCEEQGVTVRVVASLAVLDWSRAVVDSLAGQPVLTIAALHMDTLHVMTKRLIDVVGAIVGLLLLSPLFVAVAVAIKFDSKGPVFFAQDRVGLNRRRFRAYKFRTMVEGAERLQPALEPMNEADGPVFKIEHDPRVTRLGRWLRRLSVDELPQLLNVLRGDMSLVGPRPLPVRDVNRIDVRWHKRRFSVKPGITCLWQVTRREPKFDDWVRSDMEYIDNWSLGLDFRILAKTVPAVFSGHGAH